MKDTEVKKQEIQNILPHNNSLEHISDYHAVFEALGDAILILNPETGSIYDANRKTCEMYGYTIDEVVRMKWGDINGGSSPYESGDPNLRIMKAAHEVPQLFEWLAKDKEGKLFWVEADMRLADIGGRSLT